MRYEIGYKNQSTVSDIQSTAELNEAFGYIKPNDSVYISMESESGYIQAAGSNNYFTAELRINLFSGFKHYRLGNKATSKVWTEINSEAGTINVLTHEVFSFIDVKSIFQKFLAVSDESGFREIYNLRNITREFTRDHLTP